MGNWLNHACYNSEPVHFLVLDRTVQSAQLFSSSAAGGATFVVEPMEWYRKAIRD